MDMQPMAPAAAPQAPAHAGAGAGPSAPAGYEICLRVIGDGTYQVSKEPLDAEAGEPGEGAGAPGAGAPGEGESEGNGGEQAQTIDSFEGALKAVYGIYKANPEGADSEAQMTQEFNAGGNGE